MTTPNKTPPGADPKQLERTGTVREIGSQAVWSLSSCKPGFGVDQLRDDNLETYWQSDGSQPHLVNIQFRRKTTVKTLCIYADYKSDESYTPSKISVRVGNNFHNLQEIRQLELVEPSGWIHVPLTDTHKKPIRTFMIQIAVLANHQNGRDTHMRQIKVYTPVEESSIAISGLGIQERRRLQPFSLWEDILGSSTICDCLVAAKVLPLHEYRGWTWYLYMPQTWPDRAARSIVKKIVLLQLNQDSHLSCTLPTLCFRFSSSIKDN
ncbi:anaphase-promoting complex subunit 10 isoform X2 [Opisthocomus hoazin]|uniref:anaphase-promoting complex subunit 10 isoform X2 n=1 Tax=Opisthocomus hoazin TaxID=30419 RepID=UPI003F537795